MKIKAMKNNPSDPPADRVPPSTYYEQARPEVAARVPRECRIIVDVGCGAGALGAMLKRERPGVEVRGVEPVESKAMDARGVLDDVLCGQADDPLPENWPRPDCVIFSDVLEHMIDPWKTLRLWHDRLAPGGYLVISIPNVGHKSVIGGLLRGAWNYSHEGILDRTHLRFFTRKTAMDLVRQAGFRILSLDSAHKIHWLTRAAKGLEKLLGKGRSPGFLWFATDIDTSQFIIVAMRAEGPGPTP
jgi:2-polyprenyl-3-methyl-5-hydroxy-6-metoxy-1,4-benzoquinol methylase